MSKINNFFLTTALLVLSLPTMAIEDEDVVCLSNTVSPIHHAQFSNLNTTAPKVTLVIKSKVDNSAKILNGTCKYESLAIESAMSCNISTSTDSGYRLFLYSKGGVELEASVAKWSMLGDGPRQLLNCQAF